MPEIYPLGHPEFTFDSVLNKFVELPGVELQGATLGQLLSELEKATGARVVPDPESPKFFLYYRHPDSDDCELVDIHVLREGQELCPKQDLGFALLPGDKVVPGPLAC